MIYKCEICGADVEEAVAVHRTVPDGEHVFCSVLCEEQWEAIEKERAQAPKGAGQSTGKDR